MAHDFKAFPELTNSQMENYYFESPHKQITGNFRGVVTKVIDGDTIRIKCDFRDFDFPIRFAEINAPEMGVGGEQSRSWLEKQIMGEEVEIIIDQNNRVEKWGRLLGEVIHQGMNMGEMSLMFGYSVVFGDETGMIPQEII